MAFFTKVKALLSSFVPINRLVFILSARRMAKDMSFISVLSVLTLTGLRSLAFRSAYNKNRLAQSSLVSRLWHKASNPGGDLSRSVQFLVGKRSGALSYSVRIETQRLTVLRLRGVKTTRCSMSVKGTSPAASVVFSNSECGRCLRHGVFFERL
jgi:hypothetical protein